MKMIWRRGMIVIAAMVCLLGKPASSVALATYYIDNVAGSDSNSGTSETSPWKSISKVNSANFLPGDVINFKRGSVCAGTTLVIDSSGVSGNPVTYQAYGTGNRPEIVAPSGSYTESINVTGDWKAASEFQLTLGLTRAEPLITVEVPNAKIIIAS